MNNTTIKYVIVTHDSYIGLIWESNGREVIVLDKSVEIDLDYGFEVRDYTTGTLITEKL